MSIIIKIINFIESKIEFSNFCSYSTTTFNILDNTTELYMTKYINGEIFSSGGATLYKNLSDQTVEYYILLTELTFQFSSWVSWKILKLLLLRVWYTKSRVFLEILLNSSIEMWAGGEVHCLSSKHFLLNTQYPFWNKRVCKCDVFDIFEFEKSRQYFVNFVCKKFICIMYMYIHCTCHACELRISQLELNTKHNSHPSLKKYTRPSLKKFQNSTLVSLWYLNMLCRIKNY